MTTDKKPNRARGGEARASRMTAEERSASARKAAKAKAEMAKLPKATHGSSDHPLRIGDVELPCYVLSDGTRVISQRGLQAGIGMSLSGAPRAGEVRVANFLVTIVKKAEDNPHLSARCEALIERVRNPIQFTPLSGGRSINGYEATVLADLCDVILEARTHGSLHPSQAHIASQSEILVRGFARVGIIALIDEATGYQRDRAKDSLAKILEAFVAKELQPYVKTFPAGYYEEMFRLRGLQYPPENPKFRPQYFGVLTNDIVYERLAPGLLEELKRKAAKDEKKAHLHRRLTQEVGHPKLREHLASVVTAMKLSDDYSDFIRKLNRLHPRFGDTIPLQLDEPDRG
jgi:hypothetical protein